MKMIRIVSVFVASFLLSGLSQAQEDRMQQIVPPAVKIVRATELQPLVVNELVTANPVPSQQVMVSQTRLKKGGKSPHHNHPEEELIVVISGQLKVISATGEHIVGPGDVVVCESYAEHQFEALEDVFMVEAFGPGRVIGAPPIGD